MLNRLKHALQGALFALLVVFAASANAAPAKVALVHGQDPNALQQKTLTRLRAELVAAGFDVTEIERRGADAREIADADPAAEGAFATIVIVPRTGDAADIWVADRITGKTSVRRVQAPTSAGHDGASILAVRAVELLRASLLEALEPQPREVSSSSAAPTAPVPAILPSDVSMWMQARRPADRPSFGLQAGLGMLHSFSGLGPAFLPVIALSYRIGSDHTLGFRGGGPAFAANLRAPAGTIAARQELAMLEMTYEVPWPTARVRPVALAGAGVYHLAVVGTASPPYQGESGNLVAAVFAAGPGAKFQLGERVSIFADIRVLLIAPQPIVRAAKEDVGSMSRPSLFGETLVDVAF